MGDKFSRKWGLIHNGPIADFVVTSDNKYLITAGIDRTIKQWLIEKQLFVKDWGQIDSCWGDSTPLNLYYKAGYLFAFSDTGYLDQFNLKRRTITKKWSKILTPTETLQDYEVV